ncbi:hypothetical protein [Amycolatopsis sp. CA-128772]|uniref:hypothetical protein n=1 Tax=Amycolatopsis sp. CA-128772 TaxID=2073159 RepID=UPI000CD0AA9A|nr:hypothetical protein [Amycolatopsis sp. CA-128772]
MTTPQAPSTPDQTWGGAPAPGQAPKPAWSPGRKVAAGAVAAVIVAGGGAAIWAASSSAATDTQGGMMGGPGGGMGGLGSALHGEYVSSDGNGGYVTKITQTGEVTALSATSLTAKSDDGFSKTYTITSAQATGLATGDTVTVVATESGSTATATLVTDGEAGGQGQAPGGGQGTPPSGGPTRTG